MMISCFGCVHLQAGFNIFFVCHDCNTLDTIGPFVSESPTLDKRSLTLPKVRSRKKDSVDEQKKKKMENL